MFGLKRENKGKKYIEEKYGVDVQPVVAYDSGYESLYSIKDLACDEFNPPFVCKNDKMALRVIKDSIKGRKTLMNEYPQDYELHCLGTFDKNNGVVTPNCRLVVPLINILKTLNEEIIKDEIQK